MSRKQLIAAASKNVGAPISRGMFEYASKKGFISPAAKVGTWNLYTETHLNEFVSYLKTHSQNVVFGGQA